jgi:D-alanine-D-alanine ligase
LADRPLAMIVYNRVEPDAKPDEADVLVQAEAVSAALQTLGYRVQRLEADLDLDALRRELAATPPALVFNLVESLDGSDRLSHLAPALFEHLGQRFTGAPADATFLTTHKLIAKTWLRAHAVPTPDGWCVGQAAPAADAGSQWIVKSMSAEASFGLDDDSVVTGFATVGPCIARSRARWGGDWFAERFIDGREINVSLLAGPGGPAVLPLAEIRFRDFPPGKARLVGYRAKWEESSFEYQNTVRQFLDEQVERELCKTLREIALRCWDIFGLRGYARIDFRMDASGRPWVLDVNANPCLSPDAGFAAALSQSGLAFSDGIARIVADAWTPPDQRP